MKPWGLPSGWRWTTLGDLLREPLRNGKSAKEARHGQVRVLTLSAVTYGDFSDANTKLVALEPSEVEDLILQEGDFLVERSNSAELVGIGRLYGGEPGTTIFPDLMIRVRLANGIPPALVQHYFQHPEVRRYFQTAARGIAGSMPKISQGTLEDLPVPLASAPELTRLGEALDCCFSRLDAAQASLERVQQNLERYRTSVLSAAVGGRLVPTEAELAREDRRDYEPASVLLERILKERRERWEEAELAKMVAKGKPPKNDKWKAKYKEPAAPDASDLPELPDGWAWATAEALSDATRSISYGVIKLGKDTPGGIPVLRSSNVRRLSFEDEYVKCVAPRIEEPYRRTRLEGGEVLVTVRGTLGGVACVPEAHRGSNISREVAMIALVDPHVGPALAVLIASPMLQHWMSERTRGITYQGVNIATLKVLPIPVPPLKEQRRIVRQVEHLLSVADAVESAMASNLARLSRQRQAILGWAFEGKLVDHDPGDEPAQVLIERIRAERETVSGKPKRRGGRKTRKT